MNLTKYQAHGKSLKGWSDAHLHELADKIAEARREDQNLPSLELMQAVSDEVQRRKTAGV